MHNSNIFKHSHLGDYLESVFNLKKLQNPSYSLRAWSIDLSMGPNSALHQVLKHKRNFPKKYLKNLVENLKLGQTESTYLSTLIDKFSAKSKEDIDFLNQKLQRLKPNSTLKYDIINDHEFWSNPLTFIIREMTQLKDFKADVHWIQERLDINVAYGEIFNVLNELTRRKIIKEDNGKFILSKQHLYTVTDESKYSFFKKYHESILKLAFTQYSKNHIDERYYNATAFNIKKEKLDEAKKMISEFQKKLIAFAEANQEEGEETYQFSSQFFKLTKNRSKS